MERNTPVWVFIDKIKLEYNEKTVFGVILAADKEKDRSCPQKRSLFSDFIKINWLSTNPFILKLWKNDDRSGIYSWPIVLQPYRNSGCHQ